MLLEHHSMDAWRMLRNKYWLMADKMKKIPNICMRRLPWISQLELKELEMSKIQHHIWKQILYHHRNNFKNMDFFKVLLSRMKNHCHAKKKGRRSSLLFPPLPPGTIVTVITFQSPLKEYFFAGQKKSNKKMYWPDLYWQQLPALWFLSSGPSQQTHHHALDASTLCVFTSSKEPRRGVVSPPERALVLCESSSVL